MSMDSYKIFDAVVKHQSFVRAAESINLTPSAISRSITSLEKKLGFQLFVRNRKGTKLTHEGENILPLIKAILNAEESLNQYSAEILGLECGTVILGAFSSVCSNWIPDIVKTFKMLYPKIQIQIMQGDYDDVINWTKDGIIDIGFASLPLNDNLNETPLIEDQLLCVTPKDFIAKHPDFVTIDEIQNQSFVLQRDGYNLDTISFIKKNKLVVHPEFFIDDDQSILAIVEKGLGISVIPELILKRLLFDVNIYHFKPNEFRTIGLITKQSQRFSPAAKRLFEHIVEYTNRNLK